MSPDSSSAPRSRDEVWESLGAQDADWAVSSHAGRKHGGWADDLVAFYAEGEQRVDEALRMLPPAGRHAALDWGSGTGRLSFALAERFQRVTCVDVSTSMLALLRDRAAERGIENLTPVEVSAFEPVGDHDLALSLITMQHFPDRETVRHAIVQMVRAVRPGGLVLFELPLQPRTLRYRVQPRLQVYRVLRRLGVRATWLHDHGLSGISMLCAPADWVTGVLEAAGATVRATYERVGTSHIQMYYVAERAASDRAAATR